MEPPDKKLYTGKLPYDSEKNIVRNENDKIKIRTIYRSGIVGRIQEQTSDHHNSITKKKLYLEKL